MYQVSWKSEGVVIFCVDLAWNYPYAKYTSLLINVVEGIGSKFTLQTFQEMISFLRE